MDMETIAIRIKQTIIVFMLLIVGAAIGAAGLYIANEKSLINVFDKQESGAKKNQKNTNADNKTYPELTIESVKNAEYKVLNYGGKTIRLNNGAYRKESLDGNSEYYVGIYNNEIAFVDLNQDGKQEALVILDSYSESEAHLYELAMLVNREGHPFNVDSEDLGDRVIINKLSIESNEIHINLMTHGKNDKICCPSVKTVFQYVFSENQLKKVSQYALDIDETASWGLHKNEQLKFEIKYPDNFFSQEPEISISEIKDENSIQECAPRKFEGFEVRKTKINNISYCVTESSGIIANAKYVDSSYTGVINKKLVTLHFFMKYKDCKVLGSAKSPEYVNCEYFNSDIPRVTEKVVSALKLPE